MYYGGMRKYSDIIRTRGRAGSWVGRLGRDEAGKAGNQQLLVPSSGAPRAYEEVSLPHPSPP